MTVSLFDSGPRSDPTPAKYGESRYAFFNRAKSEWAGAVRELLDTWYRSFPDSDSHLRTRLQSDDDRSHSAAFWELYLYSVYRAAGFEVEVHPDITGDDTRTAPDFLIHGLSPFIVEARLVVKPAHAQKREAEDAVICDALNTLKSDNFYVHVDVQESGSQSPSLNRLKMHVTEWLKSLDVDQVYEAMRANGMRGLPTTLWEDRGWRVALSANAKDPRARGAPGRLVGMTGSFEVRYIDDHSPLLRTLKSKAPGRYGDFDHPYVIAVLSENLFVDEVDVASALFGREAVQFAVNPGSELRGPVITRHPDGFWFGPKGLQNNRVTGVLVALSLYPWTIATVEPRLWINPYSGASFPESDQQPWASARPNHRTQEMEKHPSSRPIADLIGVSSDWPGEQDLQRI